MNNLALGGAALLLAACTNHPIPTPFGNLAVLHQGELGLYRVNSPAQPPKVDAKAQHNVPARGRSIPQAFRGAWIFPPDNPNELRQHVKQACGISDAAGFHVKASTMEVVEGSFTAELHPKHYTVYADNQIRGTGRIRSYDLGKARWAGTQSFHLYLHNGKLYGKIFDDPVEGKIRCP